MVEYSVREKCAEKDTIIKILWFGGEGQRKKQHDRDRENIWETIKIKMGFYSCLGKATKKNFDVQVKWASVQSGEVPRSVKNPKFIFLPEVAVDCWSQRLGTWVG